MVPRRQSPSGRQAHSIAILPWGDAIEDFLSPLGLEPRSYLARADGGWLFGYVASLQAAGFRPVILWGSTSVTTPERLTHPMTGATIWLFPARSPGNSGSPSLTSIRRWHATPVGVVKQLLESEHCRAIIAQDYEDARFDAWVRLGGHLRIPVFASFQGGDRSASRIESAVRSRSIARSAGLIVASAAERERIAARYGRQLPPVIDIPNPIDAKLWRPVPRDQARRALKIAPTAFLVFNHGRIDLYRKGLDVLLAGWAKLGRIGGERLVIVGSGQDNAAFARLLRAPLSAGVNWRAEYVTDKEQFRLWLSAADMYVTASRVEGMPVAPLEAMACGLPLLATDAQGLTDILARGEEDGGILIAKDDPQALADGVRRLRDDPDLRRRLGRAARQRVESAFSIEEVGNALGNMLRPHLA